MAGLVIAIIALLLSALPIINNFAFAMAVVSLVLGIAALISMKKKDGKLGMSITVIILSVVAGGIVMGSQAMYGQALNEVGKGIEEATRDKTEDNLRDKVDVEFGEFSVKTDEYGIESTALPVTVKNKGSEKATFYIKVEAVDASGTRIEEGSFTVNDLAPGQSQKETIFTFVTSDKSKALKSATFKVTSVN